MGEGSYFRKLGAKQGFAAGVKAMLNDADLRRAHDIEGVIASDIDKAFERWWSTQRKSRR